VRPFVLKDVNIVDEVHIVEVAIHHDSILLVFGLIVLQLLWLSLMLVEVGRTYTGTFALHLVTTVHAELPCCSSVVGNPCGRPILGLVRLACKIPQRIHIAETIVEIILVHIRFFVEILEDLIHREVLQALVLDDSCLLFVPGLPPSIMHLYLF